MANTKQENDDAVVRKAPLFSALDDASAAKLLASMTPAKVSRGSTLFKEGDAGDRLYVVVDGKLKLGTSSVDGRENLLSILGPGDMFGELSLFDPGPRFHLLTTKLLVGLPSTHKFHSNF